MELTHLSSTPTSLHLTIVDPVTRQEVQIAANEYGIHIKPSGPFSVEQATVVTSIHLFPTPGSPS